MRLFNFRVWDSKTNQMFYSGFYDICNGEHANDFRITVTEILRDNKEPDIMMSTGLTDTNDEEIWEGDIVQAGPNRYTVEYNNGKFSASMYNTGGCEIVGNIFESKESN